MQATALTKPLYIPPSITSDLMSMLNIGQSASEALTREVSASTSNATTSAALSQGTIDSMRMQQLSQIRL
jgi:hypothetical protein